ncbi:hypothetical protein PT103_08560 [Erysipelothrix rhusiopathiae]|nr:hypothetical protein [Erysipelothrix rhusiopathiae]MDE8166968.1 hypothetical protein [Erysipelothrix rhusiopathiae]MDE8209523.1 hypothetical protein [Erysipelothrix rhusiopathiae]
MEKISNSLSLLVISLCIFNMVLISDLMEVPNLLIIALFGNVIIIVAAILNIKK